MSASGDQPNPPRNDKDLTARARIRNAALTEFAANGFRGASIRAIARAAGVSPGLVQHHFGSKEGLQRACDKYVLETLYEGRHSIAREGAPTRPDYMADLFTDLSPVVDYLVTSLASDSETAAKWFDEIASYTHDVLTSGDIGPALTPEDDDRAIAAVQAAMALGITVFYRQLRHTLRDSRDESEFMLRIGRARVFLASERVLGHETRDQLQEGFDRVAHTRETSHGTQDPNDDE